jgi:hypothetical protein
MITRQKRQLSNAAAQANPMTKPNQTPKPS